MGDTVATVWDWLDTPTVPLAFTFALLSFLAGGVAAAVPYTWNIFRSAATWVHEAGHAIVALLTGRSVTGIRVNADSSGLTEHVGSRTGLGRVLTAFAGYPAPVIAAYGIVAGITAGKYHLVVGVMIVSVAILFPLHRNVRGFWWAMLYLLFSVSLVVMPATFGQVALFLLAGFFTVATPRTIIVLHQSRAAQRRNPDDEPVHSDADTLSQLTKIPAIMWEGMFFAVTGLFCWLMVLAIKG